MRSLLSQHSEFFTFAACVAVASGIHAFWLWKTKRTQLPWHVHILGVCVLIGAWLLSDMAGGREQMRIERMTGDFARLYGDEMEKRGHSRLANDAAADDPLYLELIKTEKRWLALNRSVSDIYTLRKQPDGKCAFVVDSETDYDHDGKYEGERELRTDIGEVYEEADASMERAFLGEATFAFEPITDRWGTWVSAFVPLISPDGAIEGVLGVDFDASNFAHIIAAAKWRVLGFMALVQIVLLGSSSAISLLRAEVIVRQRAYTVLRESEKRFSGAFEHAPIGVALVLTDGRWLKVNRALCDLLGYTETELLTHNFQSVTHPDELEECRAQMLQMIGGEIGRFLMEKRYIHSHGHAVTTLTSVSLVRDDNGQPLYLVAHIQDITERKRVEEDLRRKTALMEAQVSASLDGIIIVDQEGRKILQNQRTADIFKIPSHIAEKEYDGEQRRWITDTTKNPKAFLERVHHLYAHPDEIGRDEIELKDGTVIDRYSSPVVGKDGKHYGRIWSFRDITESKHAANALSESKRFLQSTVDALSSHIAILDELGAIIEVNAAWNSFATQNGLSPNSRGLGNNYLHLCDGSSGEFSEEASAVADGIRAIMAGQRTEFHLEYPCHSPNEKRWFTVRITRFAGDGPVRVVVAHENITERKHAENALRESQHFAESIAENSTSIIYLFELGTGRSIYSNRNVAEFLGCTHAQIHAFDTNILATVVHPDDLPRIAQQHAYYAKVKDNTVFDLEFRLKNAAGEWRWIWARETVFNRRPDGTPWQILGTAQDITERKQADATLAKLHSELVDASRRAGMAEVATGVLHNVGNVLNSVNVSAACVADGVRHSKLKSLTRAAALLREHEQDLPNFFSRDPRGAQLPSFLEQLALRLAGEQSFALTELANLQKNIEHIKDIVAMQQNYGKISGVSEKLDVAELIEDTLRMSAGTLERHRVEVVREFGPVPRLMVDKHKVLQILVNLVGNAKHACEATDRPDRTLTVRLFNGDGTVKVSVSDNGVGIPQENLLRIFNHGFTTKPKGHGFGLHIGALAAQEMGGSLNVHSDGPGRGATFTLALPLNPS